MTRDEFINKLEQTDLSQLEKVEVCQFFLDNYPVVTKNQGFTKLNIKIDGGTVGAVDVAFAGLVKNIEKLKSYDKR